MYKVGSEIPSGEYYLVASGGLPAYYQIDADSSGEFDSIISNRNIEAFAFLTADSGQYLTVARGKLYPAEDASVPGPDSDGTYGAGMYRVGIDIPADEYKVTASGGLPCYLEVAADSYGTLGSIVSNENFDGSMYISVYDGQYLTVNRGSFRPA